jgi:hypothetical protein
MTSLPKHLQDLVNKLNEQEAALEALGVTPMHKIVAQQQKNMDANPNHILHAYIGG